MWISGAKPVQSLGTISSVCGDLALPAEKEIKFAYGAADISIRY
jgi:hypothetical protein